MSLLREKYICQELAYAYSNSTNVKKAKVFIWHKILFCVCVGLADRLKQKLYCHRYGNMDKMYKKKNKKTGSSRFS